MSDVYFSENFNDYKLDARSIDNEGNLNLRITHRFGGKHFAEHLKIQVFDLKISNNLKYFLFFFSCTGHQV